MSALFSPKAKKEEEPEAPPGISETQRKIRKSKSEALFREQKLGATQLRAFSAGGVGGLFGRKS